jgi:hypothetical protein
VTTANDTPAAQKTLTLTGSVANVPIASMCRVRYEFDTTASGTPDLALRYVVAIDGRVADTYSSRPRVLDKRTRAIDIRSPRGTTVSLYLNSDCHPAHRQHPVYAVKVGANDVHVKIQEVRGINDGDTPVLRPPVRGAPLESGGTPTDLYSATLSAKIWMDVSHRYSPPEVNALLPQDTAPVFREAVMRIFSGLAKPELIVTFPAHDGMVAHTIKLKFADATDVHEHTKACPLLAEVLTRVHPLAYYSLLVEARAVGIANIAVTSSWRPLTGSIVHRSGLGLDINYLDASGKKHWLNRIALRLPGGRGRENVSEQEPELREKYLSAKKHRADLAKESQEKKRQLEKTRDPVARASIQVSLTNLDLRLESALVSEQQAEAAWRAELDSHQPDLVKHFRERLARNPAISQLFDPWYMDSNTRDSVPATMNAQQSPNEVLHSHHLHITVREPYLL